MRRRAADVVPVVALAFTSKLDYVERNFPVCNDVHTVIGRESASS
jgi:hypothetical protein